MEKKIRKKKEDVIRVGDVVMIMDNAKFIERVGYKLHFEWDYLNGSPEKALSVVNDSNAILEILNSKLEPGSKKLENVPSYLQTAVAKIRVEQASFGGNERVIIYEKPVHSLFADIMKPPANLTQHRVSKKSVKYTGTRVAPSSYYSEDGYEYEDGCLEDSTAHVILELSCGRKIEDIHVKKVKKYEEKVPGTFAGCDPVFMKKLLTDEFSDRIKSGNF